MAYFAGYAAARSGSRSEAVYNSCAIEAVEAVVRSIQLTRKLILVFSNCVRLYVKKLKAHPSAMLSYISTRGFLRTREKCKEKHELLECS